MTAMMTPASLRMATLFPCCAIRVNLPALPCRLFEKFEKAFVCRVGVSDVVDSNSQGGRAAYGRVDDGLVAGIVVNVDGDAAQGRDLSGEVVESRVVLAVDLVSGCVVPQQGRKVWLPFTFVGFRHCGDMLRRLRESWRSSCDDLGSRALANAIKEQRMTDNVGRSQPRRSLGQLLPVRGREHGQMTTTRSWWGLRRAVP
jgi:hypothetical protein